MVGVVPYERLFQCTELVIALMTAKDLLEVGSELCQATRERFRGHVGRLLPRCWSLLLPSGYTGWLP